VHLVTAALTGDGRSVATAFRPSLPAGCVGGTLGVAVLGRASCWVLAEGDALQALLAWPGVSYGGRLLPGGASAASVRLALRPWCVVKVLGVGNVRAADVRLT